MLLCVQIHKIYPLLFSVSLSAKCKHKNKIIIKILARHCKVDNIMLSCNKKIPCSETLVYLLMEIQIVSRMKKKKTKQEHIDKEKKINYS